jgi:hypothetical protein
MAETQIGYLPEHPVPIVVTKGIPASRESESRFHKIKERTDEDTEKKLHSFCNLLLFDGCGRDPAAGFSKWQRNQAGRVISSRENAKKRSPAGSVCTFHE